MFRLQIIKSGTLIQERTYTYSAHECTIGFYKAWDYYFDKNEVVDIVMTDHRGVLVYSVTTDTDRTSPCVSEASEAVLDSQHLAPVRPPGDPQAS